MSEKPLTYLDVGRLYPVCCATDLSAQVKDQILEEAQDGMGVDHYLVFVDSLTKQYAEVSDHGYNEPSDSASPFKGKTPEECAALLQQLRRNGADINFQHFAVVDERSLQDETLWLVKAPAPEEGTGFHLRAVYKLTCAALMNWHLQAGSEWSLEEVQSSEDGVLRRL
ncbi:hypothetical protein LTR86_003986 [Recurvomyces mirabilis]|nr:hypothetical protein LTR86_003986 [Recurvomyces mirabilis]